ncbi:hypothetical protein GPECTOR_33g614 [Gonium pectorale]|uniref:Uncharacterized protein n=1 Tax=Gonium pectorale TaxID=33097 RepID=A0A150GD22_GONPE|nr:hypothetical protein GPECTOR_33g614 [Gonium pectorale]|eukprot:KXZ47732.1 hypothetical protein GPECTOR_33g614 [Gonium pectorale]
MLRRASRGQPPIAAQQQQQQAGGAAGPAGGAAGGSGGSEPPVLLRPFLPFEGASTDGSSDEPYQIFWAGHLFTPSPRTFYSSAATTTNIHCVAVLQPNGYDNADPHRAFLLDRLQLPAAYLRGDVVKSIMAEQAWEGSPSAQFPDELPPLPPGAVEAARRELSTCPTEGLEDFFLHCYHEREKGAPWGVLLVRGLHARLEGLLARLWRLRQQLAEVGEGAGHGGVVGLAAWRAPVAAGLPGSAGDGVQRMRADEAALEQEVERVVRGAVQETIRYQNAAQQAEVAGAAPPRSPPPEDLAIAKLYLLAREVCVCRVTGVQRVCGAC